MDCSEEAELGCLSGGLSKRARKKIRAIAMDIWDLYLASLGEQVPDVE